MCYKRYISQLINFASFNPNISEFLVCNESNRPLI